MAEIQLTVHWNDGTEDGGEIGLSGWTMPPREGETLSVLKPRTLEVIASGIVDEVAWTGGYNRPCCDIWLVAPPAGAGED